MLSKKEDDEKNHIMFMFFRVTSNYVSSVIDWTLCHSVRTLHSNFLLISPLRVKPEGTTCTSIWILWHYVSHSVPTSFADFFCYHLLKKN